MAEGLAILTVTQLTTYIKSQFEGDKNLVNVFVTGEISNFMDNYRSGHLYFSLKDGRSLIRAVMFARNASRLRFQPENGMKVIVRGRVGVYEVSGQYQLYVADMQPEGLGALNLAFEQLKAKLEKEGLFSTERKKAIPKFPQKIGVITSPTGAAVHDIITVLGRRYPLAEVIFCPVQVQGKLAAPQIVAALDLMNRRKCADVIIVGRGGGSLEDLWPFNEEPVARAVAASEIPVISAVGHETDFTICDFAADLRAPTPSAAAELAVPDRAELFGAVQSLRHRLVEAAEKEVTDELSRLVPLTESRVLKSPFESIELRREHVGRLVKALNDTAAQKAESAKVKLSGISGRLNALSPLAVLSRGYAAIFNEVGKPVSMAHNVSKDEKITVRFSDGALNCTVDGKEEKAGYEQKNDV